MSDFDKEAERERLREKYEQDQQKRQSTERMSELLLKGATMTDAHCENCRDPIFRYEGDEFCPTCQQLVESDAEADESDGAGTSDGDATDDEAAGAEADQADAGATDREPDTGTSDTIEMKRPTGPTADEIDANGEATTAGASSGQEPTPDQGTPNRGTPDRGTPDRGTPDQTAPRRGQQATQEPSTSTPSAPAQSSGAAPGQVATEGGDLADARASLTRALQFHAGQAAETADPRRAKDHLAAAREAAEALSALY